MASEISIVLNINAIFQLCLLFSLSLSLCDYRLHVVNIYELLPIQVELETGRQHCLTHDVILCELLSSWRAQKRRRKRSRDHRQMVCNREYDGSYGEGRGVVLEMLCQGIQVQHIW